MNFNIQEHFGGEAPPPNNNLGEVDYFQILQFDEAVYDQRLKQDLYLFFIENNQNIG